MNHCANCGKPVHNPKSTTCRDCNGTLRRLTEDDYRSAAKAKGIEWIGTLPERNSDKTKWRCICGNEFDRTYTSIKDKRTTGRCPSCARIIGRDPLRKRPEDYHAVALRNGIEWIGPVVEATSIPTWWRCSEGHEWKTKFTHIDDGGQCPHCRSRQPDEYHTLAKEHGYEWLGPETNNVKVATQWRCARGHIRTAAYRDIERSPECTICANYVNGRATSYNQRQIAEDLQGVLNYKVGRFYIDVALLRNSCQIAIEYDSWYWHAEKEQGDSVRAQELIESGWRVLRIKSAWLIPSREQLDDAISRLINGESYLEIILGDWGAGKARGDK